MEEKMPFTAAQPQTSAEVGESAEERWQDEAITVATPRQLMWWKFKRHRVGVASVVFLMMAYFIALFADFFAPYAANTRSENLLMPPDTVHFVDASGNFHLRPFVYGLNQRRDLKTLAYVYEENTDEIYPIQFFVHAEPYKLWGIIDSNLHLFGVEGRGIYLVGTDNLGRDLLSRVLFGARISLSVGLISVFVTLLLGLVIGGISGLYGGWVDNIIQRVIEAIISIPSIPLWMGLAAAIPITWSPVAQYTAILVVLSLIGWTSVARIARGKFLSTREQDFVMAAQIYGCGQWRIITRHLIPTFMSFVIVRITLDIPRIIIAETALSFLGIGLREPTVSWGVMLQAAQKFQVVSLNPWLWIAPAVCIVVVVLAFNFVGDAARDAADPFAK